MISLATNRKMFHACLWLFAGLALLVLVTSCSPLAVYEQIATPSATATAKLANLPISTPAPYWQLAADAARHIIPAITGGKVSH